jgi:hypothetical protein
VTSAGGPGNLGTIFKINAAGSYSVTAHLSPPAGWMPSGAPVIDSSGGLLFPLAAGGSAGGGTLASWSEGSGLSVAAALGGTFGSTPDGGLILKAGDYYGVASQGAASGRGAAFRYQPGNGISLVSSFTSTGGALPEGALIDGSDGALYGVGREGGTSARGTVFKVTTAGDRTRVISFTGLAGTTPGSSPRGPLVLAASQSYYGLAASGGSSDRGVLFKISPFGTYTVLAHFTITGPRLPAGGLVMGADGFIYGTCSSGGTADAGALIRLNPANDTWSVVASFDGTTAASPAGELHAAADGSILGIATGPGNGGVFRYSAAAGIQVVATFDGNNGRATADNGAGLVFTGGLTTTADGTIYGNAPGGGPAGGGVLFRIAGNSPLAAWKTLHLGSPTASDDDDPDRDGLANVLEYALGKIPTLPDAAGQPAASVAANFLRLTVPRDPARNDIVMIVEATCDLAAWTPLAASINGAPFTGPGYLSGETPGSGMKSIVVRDLMPVTAAPRRFLRLRVLSGFTAATPLETWKMTYLGDPAAPDDGDPDLDGHVNVLEYALGTLRARRHAAPGQHRRRLPPPHRPARPRPQRRHLDRRGHRRSRRPLDPARHQHQRHPLQRSRLPFRRNPRRFDQIRARPGHRRRIFLATPLHPPPGHPLTSLPVCYFNPFAASPLPRLIHQRAQHRTLGIPQDDETEILHPHPRGPEAARRRHPWPVGHECPCRRQRSGPRWRWRSEYRRSRCGRRRLGECPRREC